MEGGKFGNGISLVEAEGEGDKGSFEFAVMDICGVEISEIVCMEV